MDELYNCPVDGCNYGPSGKNSVAAHYSGKKPETGHEGGYERALTKLEQADPAEQAKPAEQTKPAEQAGAAEQAKPAQQAKPADRTPVADGPDPSPTVVDHNEGPTCPECQGTNLFDARPHTDGRFTFGCRDCSDGQSWEVFNA